MEMMKHEERATGASAYSIEWLEIKHKRTSEALFHVILVQLANASEIVWSRKPLFNVQQTF